MEKKPKKKTQVLAHSRRQRENDTFTDIAQALPIQENAKDLDKASILRLAIHYLKLRDLVRDGNDQFEGEEGEEGVARTESEGEVGSSETPLQLEETNNLLHTDPNIADFLPNFSKDVVQALDGFLLVISRDGRVLFSSESIANYLGLRQVDVIGVNVQDIIHPQDCTEIIRIINTGGNDSEQVFDEKEPLRRKFVARMRCAFTPSVRCITRCSNFKPIFCSCFLKFGKSGAQKGQFLGMVVFCKLATLSKIKEMVVGTFFKTKHSLDLSYTNVDTRIRWILGYDPSEMTGLKAYQYFHPQDLGVTSSCHMNLLSRGISHSPCYRFMTRWGDWVWCRSKSVMVFNKNSHLPEGIIIYTWIVRVDEEDDRMLAIQSGEDGESKRKTYDGFSSSISSSAGSALDVKELANPFGKSINQTTPKTSPSAATPSSKERASISAASSSPNVLPSDEARGVAVTPLTTVVSSPMMGPSPSMNGNVSGPPIGMGVSSSPMNVGVSSPPIVMGVSSPPMNVGVSSPPMGMGVTSSPLNAEVSSPPLNVGVSSPPMNVGVSSPPMNVGISGPAIAMGVSSPPMGMMVSDPPMGVGVSSPPMGIGISSPPMGAGVSNLQTGMGISSPPMGMTTPPSSAMTDYSTSGNIDPFMTNGNGFSSDVADRSFLFDKALPLNQGFMPSPPYTPYSNNPTPTHSTGSPPYTNKCTPSPQSSCSFQIQCEEFSPYSSSSSTATPICDPMLPCSTAFQPNLPPHSVNQYMNQQTTVPVNENMCSDGIHMASGKAIEVQATFIPNGNSTSNLAGYSESFSVPMGSELTNILGINGSEFPQKHSTVMQAPQHVRQNIIHSARQRYSGVAPASGHCSNGGGLATGHVSSGADADSSISQWSQWLKGSAPAPVC